MDIVEQITALVDAELDKDTDKNLLLTTITKDKRYKFEYDVQKFTKSMVHKRAGIIQTHSYLRERIYNRLLLEVSGPSETETKKFNAKRKRSISDYLNFIITSPRFAFALMLAFITAVYFLRPEINDTSQINQSDVNSIGKTTLPKRSAFELTPPNMLLKAQENFKNILNGSVQPQFESRNYSALRKFLKQEGVTYQTVLPKFKGWQLQGGLVSEESGENFAHHIYKNKTGNLIYFYQADISALDKKLLSLSQEQLDSINKGTFYKMISGGNTLFLWKCKNNICVVVSNESHSRLDSKFATVFNSTR